MTQKPPLQHISHAQIGSTDPQQHAPAQLPSHDQLYEVGYQLALDKLGYKGMQSKIFADAFVGEYQRALENGLNDVLAIRFGAEFAGPFALAFMHYLTVNQQREEEQDIYGGARAFAQMSFDVYEEQFTNDFAPIHEEKMRAKSLQEALSKALKMDVTTENLGEALQGQYTIIYKKGHEDGFHKGVETGREEGLAEGIIEGKKFGRQEGHTQGYTEAFMELTGSAPEGLASK